MTTEAPTINEIICQQFEKLKNQYASAGLTILSRYRVGDWVQFEFYGLIRYGIITNVTNQAGKLYYNIDTRREWYRNVEQCNIKGLAAQAAITISR